MYLEGLIRPPPTVYSLPANLEPVPPFLLSHSVKACGLARGQEVSSGPPLFHKSLALTPGSTYSWHIGPRGGETTRKPGQVKKTVWLNEDEAEALRKAAFDRRMSEAALIREALRRLFGIND